MLVLGSGSRLTSLVELSWVATVLGEVEEDGLIPLTASYEAKALLQDMEYQERRGRGETNQN